MGGFFYCQPLPGGQRADGGWGEVMLHQAAVLVIVGAGGLLAVAVVAEEVEAGEAGPGQGGQKVGGRRAGFRMASVHIKYGNQCYGSVTFWYGSGDSCLVTNGSGLGFCYFRH